MTDAKARPLIVTLVAWLFVAAGIAGTLAIVVYAARSGRFREGLPLEVLGAVAAVVYLGIVVGLALLKGRPWAWFVALGCCVLALGLGGYHAAMRSGPTGAAPAAAAVGLVVGAGLLAGGTARFFGLAARRKWGGLIAELVICGAIVSGLFYLSEEDSGIAADSSQTLQSLGEQGASSDGDIRFMVERLENGNLNERVSAAWALGQSGRVDAVAPLLRAAREDADSDVRINAIGSLAALGGEEIQQDLVDFLEAEDPAIRAAGLRGLASDKFAGAAERVGQLLVESAELRGAAADVLGNMGNPDAVPYLQQVADDAEEDVRTRVAYALGKLGDPRAVTTLIGLLKDEQWSVRANAVQALGMIADPAAREALEGMRDDPNSSVRAASEAALEKLR